MLGDAVSFSVRAEQITDAPSQRQANRLTARCTAVEYFGAVRRHVFERCDGEVLKYDQFGAHAARIVPGQTVQLGWLVEETVLHTGAPG
jgi:spermidine/putrescine transport system ATP-binding protein